MSAAWGGAGRPTIGPYRLLEVIGGGRAALVYRAEHAETGVEVAVKTVSSSDEVTLAGIRREIHALRRLRHPGIVRILSDGTDSGLPWFAMDLIAGRTLRSDLSQARAIRGPRVSTEALAPALTRLRRLCATLSFVHGHGIVHRDLKPENVFIRDDGLPILVDFGIATRFGAGGREGLEVGGAAVEGSDAYMAPEQIRGEVVDGRADLYALGCILYETVTGRPPFAPSASASVLHQHLHRPPPRLSSSVEGVSEGLERLVSKLLEKSPKDRIGYADHVAAALLEAGADPVDPLPLPDAQPYLYRASLAGRDDELTTIEASLDRLGRGRGGRIFVAGESGVGKTRLAMEVATMAAWKGLSVVTGECIPLSAEGDGARGGPLHPFRPLLLSVADRCRDRGGVESDGLLKSTAAILSLYEPGLAPSLGHATPSHLAALPAEAVRALAVGALRDALFALAAERPLLLVLDDLQWADELSLLFLRSVVASGQLEDRAVLIVGTYRADEMSAAEVAVLRGPLDISLRRLDATGVGEIVGDMLASPAPPPAFVDFLHRQSNGNPFFVGEYLRAAIALGMLFRDRKGAWSWGELVERADSLDASLAVPRSIAEIVEKRLFALRDGSRALVELSSILGREFEVDVLERAARAADAPGMEGLDALRDRQILEEPATGRLRFVHDKLREVAYASIAPGRLRVLHRAAAEALELPGGAPVDLALLAAHWTKAEVPDKAREYLLRAGQQALAAGAQQQAALLFSRALELIDTVGGSVPVSERATVHHLYAQALWGMGDAPNGTVQAERALEALGVRVPRGKAATMGLVRELGEQLVRIASIEAGFRPRERPDRVRAAEAASLLSAFYVAAHRPPQDVLGMTLRAVNLAERAGPSAPRAIPCSVLAATAGLIGLRPLARWYFDRGRRDALHRADLSGYASVAIMECVLYNARAEWAASDACAEEAIAIADKAQDRPLWEALLLMRATAEVVTGRLPEAADRLGAIRRSAAARGSHYYHAWASIVLGLHAVWTGRGEAALEFVRTVDRDLADDRMFAVSVLGVSAAASLLVGDTAGALRYASDGLARLEAGRVEYALWVACDTIASTLLELWEGAARSRSRSAPALREKALAACGAARDYARQHPFGRAFALRVGGVAARIDRRPRRARARLEQGVALAQEMAMPIAEAAARFELARLEPEGSAGRTHQAKLARDGWERLGCGLWADRAGALALSTLTDEARP